MRVPVWLRPIAANFMKGTRDVKANVRRMEDKVRPIVKVLDPRYPRQKTTSLTQLTLIGENREHAQREPYATERFHPMVDPKVQFCWSSSRRCIRAGRGIDPAEFRRDSQHRSCGESTDTLRKMTRPTDWLGHAILH